MKQHRILAFYNVQERDSYFVILQERKNVAHKWEHLRNNTPSDDCFPSIFIHLLSKITVASNGWWFVEYRSNKILITFRNHTRGEEGVWKVPYTANHDELYRILAEAVNSTEECKFNGDVCVPDGSSLNVVQIKIVENWTDAEMQ